MPNALDLGRRERQIVDTVYRLGRASAAEVRAALPDPPSYSAVRAMLRILEDKGYLRHQRDGLRYLYRPAVGPEKARRSALQHMVATFFRGSAATAAAALLQMSDTELDEHDRQDLLRRIEHARKEGR